MNIHAIIPLIGLIAYIVLFVIVVFYGRTRISRRFVLILVWAAMWGGSSFLLRAGIFPEHNLLLGKILFFAGTTIAVPYYHFVRSFQNKRPDAALYLGYILMPAYAIFIALGFTLKSISVHEGIFIIERAEFSYLAYIFGLFYVGLSIISLVRSYRRLRIPEARTRTLYCLIGFGTMVAFGLLNVSDYLASYSIDHIGNVINASIIIYATRRHNLLEISFVLRKGIAYSVVTVSLMALCFFTLFLIQMQFQGWGLVEQLIAIGVVSVVAAILLRPVLVIIQGILDRVFLGRSHIFRQKLSQLPDNVDKTFELEALADSFLNLIAKSTGAKQATLLLEDNGWFTPKYAASLENGAALSGAKFSKDNPIIIALAREGEPLAKGEMTINPRFKAVWQSEERDIDAAGYELLCPLKNGETLLGILALSGRDGARPYSSEDVDIIMNAASSMAVLVGNAIKHRQLKAQTATDDLTGLFNHRFFYQCLGEQISKSSRFGTAFSVLLIDIDVFKSYNDAYGHVAGDHVLRETASFIQSAIGSNDVACRYGGDEFAIIMPDANGDKAGKTAERVRRTVEAKMDDRGNWLTVSVGVAIWPRDGVDGPELVAHADKALFHAKMNGGNRTIHFSQIPVSIKTPDSYEDMGTGTVSTVHALAATVDAKDHFTYGHSRKVSRYAAAIGEVLGLNDAALEVIRNAGLLHDIGKISVPDEVLRKPGRLNDQEWSQIRTHPEVAASILRYVQELSSCLPAILHHHERFDGSGYPMGLQDVYIPMEARILAIADAYDAMTSDRHYRKAFTVEQALDELVLNAGKQFDPQLVQTFVTLIGSTSWRVSDSQPLVITS